MDGHTPAYVSYLERAKQAARLQEVDALIDRTEAAITALRYPVGSHLLAAALRAGATLAP